MDGSRVRLRLLDDVEIVDSPELKRYVADYFRRNAAVIAD